MAGISRLTNKIFNALGLNEWGQRDIIPNDFNSEIIETNQEFQTGTIDASKIKNLNVDTITVSPTGFIRSGKTNFLDSTNAGWFLSADGIYVGAAGDTSKLLYKTSDGSFDFIGTVSSRSTLTLANSINSSGQLVTDVVNAKLDTSTKQILDGFTFGTSGAIQIGTYQAGVSGDLKISPNGIVGRNKSNETTFSINATTGDATFKGDITGATGTFGSVTINSGTVSWSTVAGTSNAPANNATVGATWNSNITNQPSDSSITNPSYITSTKITATTIESPTISAGTITGALIQTSSSSNTGVKMSTGAITIYGTGNFEVRDSAGTLYGTIGGYSGYFNIAAVSNRNMLIGASGAAVYFTNHVAPLTSNVANLGESNKLWGNVYTSNVDFGSSYYINRSGAVISFNNFTNLSIGGYTFRPVGFTFKDGSGVNKYMIVLATADPV